MNQNQHATIGRIIVQLYQFGFYPTIIRATADEFIFDIDCSIDYARRIFTKYPAMLDNYGIENALVIDFSGTTRITIDPRNFK